MFAVALLFHDRKHVGIEAVFDILSREGFSVERHNWKGLMGRSIEQVRYTTNSSDVVIQIEDDAVQTEDDVEELGQFLPADFSERLKRCRATIVIMPFQPNASVEHNNKLLSAGIDAAVPRDATLDNPDVLRMTRSLAAELNGLIFDNTENRFV